jgi:hypothetical protein
MVSQQGSTSVRIEYVKYRRILRLTGWRERGPALEPVEVALPAMLEALQIDPADVGAGAWYLLFGGREGELRGGVHDLLATYRSPNEGKARFLELQRARASGGGGWAELVVLDPSGQLKRVCWFGEKRDAWAADADVLDRASDLHVARPRRRLFGGWESAPRRRP